MASPVRAPLLAAVVLALAGCPEERPGATKEVPPQRIPPAVALEPAQTAPPRPAPPSQDAAGAPAGGGATSPAPAPAPSAEPARPRAR